MSVPSWACRACWLWSTTPTHGRTGSTTPQQTAGRPILTRMSLTSWACRRGCHVDVTRKLLSWNLGYIQLSTATGMHSALFNNTDSATWRMFNKFCPPKLSISHSNGPSATVKLMSFDHARPHVLKILWWSVQQFFPVWFRKLEYLAVYGRTSMAVSYTHLTLPTIYSV